MCTSASEGSGTEPGESLYPTGNDPLFTFFGDLEVASWRPEHAPFVAELVQRAQTVSTGNGGRQVFNPEGDVEDCWDAGNTYCSEGSGAFLVVTRPSGDNENYRAVVACGAFITGDEVASLKSGASMSDPVRTAVTAVRRLCILRGEGGVPEDVAEPLVAFLLQAIERLAAVSAMKQSNQTDALEVIALGWDGATSAAAGTPLSAAQLRGAGYAPTGRLSFNAGNVELVEYSKTIESGMKASEESRGAGKGSSEQIEVITADGTGIGVYPRATVERFNLLHVAIGCLVMDTEGNIYVHQRSPKKSVHPSRYDMYVGGLAVAGESPEDAARNEVFEELGIKDTDSVNGLEPTFIKPFFGPRNRVLVYCYKVVMPAGSKLAHNDGEVVWGDWMRPAELQQMIASEEFVPGGLAMWDETLKRRIVTVEPC